jgi:hypothetical protein
LGDRDHEGGSPQIGPCIAHRGGTVCPTAFGSLAGVFFGSLQPNSLDLLVHLFINIPGLERGIGEEIRD